MSDPQLAGCTRLYALIDDEHLRVVRHSKLTPPSQTLRLQGTTAQALCYYLALSMITADLTHYSPTCTVVTHAPIIVVQIDVVSLGRDVELTKCE